MATIVRSPRMARRQRAPQHTFQLRTRPWQIQPFLVAPVLAGESLKNLMFQARVVSDPVKNPLIGWWCEWYFWYVKLRDLDGRDDFEQMLLDPSKDISSYQSAADTDYYHYGGAINWAKLCMIRCVEWFFRDEGQAWDDFQVGNLPAAQIGRESFLNSALNAADYDAAEIDIDLNADSTITAQETALALAQWEFAQANKLTEQTFDQYLASFGVRSRGQEQHAPELVRYVRNWAYPAVHVDPTDGSPTSALAWNVAERADKARFFVEPGFVFGCQVVRPKVYYSKQIGFGAAMMEDAFRWLPGALVNEPTHALRQFAQGAGPVQNGADVDGYWIDVRDLLTYGDQFINFALTETDAGLVALPTTGLQKRYASGTDADALFASASPANQIRSDGIVHLHIASAQVDQTKGTSYV